MEFKFHIGRGRFENVILLALFVFLSAYLILRAINVPIVHDEAVTFFYYIQGGNYLPPNAHWDANNHIFNSVLSHIGFKIFGPSLLAIRLPNVISFFVFFYFLVLFSKRFTNTYIKWLFILTLCFAHNFLEFFAYTRGYGLSIGFLFGAIWHVVRALETVRPKHYFLSALFIFLALLANLTLLNTSLILIFILIGNLLYKRKNLSFKSLFISITAVVGLGIVPVIGAVILLFSMKDKGLLYYGSLDGFWEVTYRSLKNLILESASFYIDAYVILVFIFLIFTFLLIFLKRKNVNIIFDPMLIWFFLFFGNLVAVIFLGNFLDVNYPEDRTGMYFFIYFIVAFFILLDFYSEKIKPAILILSTIPILIIPAHFLRNMNLSHSSLWVRNQSVPNVFFDRVLCFQKDIPDLLTISGYHLQVLPWAFKNAQKGDKLSQLNKDNPNNLSDFQIVSKDNYPDYKNNYDIIETDEVSEYLLLKRKHFLKRELIYQTKPFSKNNTDQPFFVFFEVSKDTLDWEGKSLLIDFHFSIRSESVPFMSRVVLAVDSKDKESLYYERVPLNWKKHQWNKKFHQFRNVMIIEDLPAKFESLRTYLWNVKSQEYSIKVDSIQVFELK